MNKTCIPSTAFHPAPRQKYRLDPETLRPVRWDKVTVKNRCLGWRPCDEPHDARMLDVAGLPDPQARAFCFVHAVLATDHDQWAFHKAKADYDWLLKAQDEYEALTKEGPPASLQGRYVHCHTQRVAGALVVPEAMAALSRAKDHKHETAGKEAAVASAKAALDKAVKALTTLDSAVAAAKEKVDAVHNHAARYTRVSVVANAACEKYGEHTRDLRHLLDSYDRLKVADHVALAS